ncbi:TIM barrel protein [candidate division KSB1 bacterium]|nr:TIM barrel protein [candidate division KSB1 bacterium]
MTKPKLGLFIIADAELDNRLEAAKRLDIATAHLLAPLSRDRQPQNRRMLMQKFNRAGVQISAVFCQFEGESYSSIPVVKQTVGLVPAHLRQDRTKEAKAISDFAAELNVGITALHLGFIPEERETRDYQALVETTASFCDHCAANGQSLHLETGQESAEALLQFITDVGRKNLAINFDPANMILYGVAQPVPALKQLGDRVKSIHCKDAVWSDKPGETFGEQVPLGEGEVNIERFVQTLKSMGYTNPYTIEREIVGEDQLRDVEQGVKLLRKLIDDIYF